MFFCCPSSSRTLHLRAQLWHTAPFRPNTLQLCYARPLQRPQVMAVPLAEFSGCRCVAWQSPSCSRCELKINGAGIVKGTRRRKRRTKFISLAVISTYISFPFSRQKIPPELFFVAHPPQVKWFFCWFFLSMFGWLWLNWWFIVGLGPGGFLGFDYERDCHSAIVTFSWDGDFTWPEIIKGWNHDLQRLGDKKVQGSNHQVFPVFTSKLSSERYEDYLANHPGGWSGGFLLSHG